MDRKQYRNGGQREKLNPIKQHDQIDCAGVGYNVKILCEHRIVNII